MGQRLRNTRRQRSFWLAIYSGVFIVSLCLMAIVVSKLLISDSPPFVTRLAEIADILAGGTAILALIAGLVALQAFAAATGLPDLQVQVWFKFSAQNRPTFRSTATGGGVLHADAHAGQTTAMMFLRNKSLYSARNPSLVIRLRHVGLDSGVASGEDTTWRLFSFPDESIGGEGATTIEWDGGGDFSIHGQTTRRLPDLNVGSLVYDPADGAPLMSIQVVAEGYRRDVDVPISFVEGDEEIPDFPRSKQTPVWL